MPSEIPDKLWIHCTIENTGFSSERRFEVSLGSEGKAVGTAYVEYLKNANNQPIEDDEPEYGKSIDGFVQCRVIKRHGATYVIEFPSTDVFHVPAEALEELMA